MAMIVKADSTEQLIEVPKENQLEWLQKKVGGYIEMISIMHEKYSYMIIDEEGKLKNKKKNNVASRVAFGMILPTDYVVGTAILIKENEID